MRRSLLRALLAASLSVAVASCSDEDEDALAPLPGPVSVSLVLVAEGLTSPISLVEAPDGSGRRFIVDQAGVVRVLTADGRLLPEPFLDVRARLVPLRAQYDERGLLGLAFHPDFRTNGRVFVHYSAPRRAEAPAGFDHTGRLSEFRVSADANRVDAASERTILEIDKPQSNHNGGTITFGPDGFLYMGMGDGGGANDVGPGHVEDWYPDNGGGNGQDIEQNLLGSILRLDVNRTGSGTAYGIPADNPFVGRPGLDEIWAYGFRNPHHLSFDAGGNRDLIAADAGQVLWEEIDRVVRGGNYGWNVREGAHCFDAEAPGTSPAQCPDMAPGGVRLIDPVLEYPHPGNAAGNPVNGLAVIGGYVYRGSALPELRGRYVFGDYTQAFTRASGALYVATPRPGAERWQIQPLVSGADANGRVDDFVKGFGQDAAGEVYVLASDALGPAGTTGRVYRLAPAASAR